MICDSCGLATDDLTECRFCGIDVCSNCLPKHEDCAKEEDNGNGENGEEWDQEWDQEWDEDWDED